MENPPHVVLMKFLKTKIDYKLAGNIGYPILSVKNIRPRTFLYWRPYQLDYSRLFKTKSRYIKYQTWSFERHKLWKIMLMQN